jgi:hypothetical protein
MSYLLLIEIANLGIYTLPSVLIFDEKNSQDSLKLVIVMVPISDSESIHNKISQGKRHLEQNPGKFQMQSFQLSL